MPRTDQFRGGTSMKRSNHNAMVRYAVKHKAPADYIKKVVQGFVTKGHVYRKGWLD